MNLKFEAKIGPNRNYSFYNTLNDIRQNYPARVVVLTLNGFLNLKNFWIIVNVGLFSEIYYNITIDFLTLHTTTPQF